MPIEDQWSMDIQLKHLNTGDLIHLLETGSGTFKEFLAVRETQAKETKRRVAKHKAGEHIGTLTVCFECDSIAKKLGLD